jgi:hypothetical protein
MFTVLIIFSAIMAVFIYCNKQIADDLRKEGKLYEEDNKRFEDFSKRTK